MKTDLLRLASVLSLAAAAPAGASVDLEGPQSSGANDTPATAQRLPSVQPTSSVTVFGWIDALNENDVDFYRFTLASQQTVYIDLDFGEDAGVSGDLDVGLDAEISVFDAAGALIANNDDSDFFAIGPGSNAGTDPGSDPWADHDPFIGALQLPAGTYYVAVSYYANDPDAFGQGGLTALPLSDSGVAIVGATPDAGYDLSGSCTDPLGEQCAGPYQLQLRLDFGGVSDAEGPSASGQNDGAGSAQVLGTLQTAEMGTLTTIGWVDANNVNDVDFWQFTLPSAADVHLDVDFAEDIRATGDGDAGLDPELWVFDAAGRLIANNDDSDFFGIGGANAGTDPGSDPFADHDPFIGALPLAAGAYTVAVAYYPNNANAVSQLGLGIQALSDSGLGITGATPDTTFELDESCSDPIGEQCVGMYQLQVRPFFLPEPGALLGQVAAALAVLGLAGLRSKGRAATGSPARRRETRAPDGEPWRRPVRGDVVRWPAL